MFRSLRSFVALRRLRMTYLCRASLEEAIFDRGEDSPRRAVGTGQDSERRDVVAVGQVSLIRQILSVDAEAPFRIRCQPVHPRIDERVCALRNRLQRHARLARILTAFVREYRVASMCGSSAGREETAVQREVEIQVESTGELR